MKKGCYNVLLYFQLGHWEQPDRVLPADARLYGANQQIPHFLFTTKGGQRVYMGRYKS